MNPLAFLAAFLLAYVAAERYVPSAAPRSAPIPLDDLPELIEGLSLCVEAGMDALHAVVQLAERRSGDPLAVELLRVAQEVRTGAAKVEAWKRLGERIDTEEMRLFVGVILQGDALGNGMARSLRNLAESIREHRFRVAEQRALQAPVKLLLPMMCVFLALFCLIGGALYLDIRQGGGL
jgi:tight adherence protein C